METMNPTRLSCSPDMLASGYVIPMDQTGLLSLEGEDAVRFIHGQLSNDIEHLDGKSARLAAYCTPQGRMLARFCVWKSAGKVWMSLPADILDALKKRLQIYILRAKVVLSDERGNVRLVGIGGKRAAASLSRWFPDLPDVVYGKTENENGVLVRMADAFGAPRYLLAVSALRYQAMYDALASELPVCGADGWTLGDIEAGVPDITLAVQDRFVPQMVNLEEAGGLSFTKGCYPGQEVIARSQFRGAVKRKLFHGYVTSGDVDIPAGADLVDRDGNPCGVVLQSARRDGGRTDFLAVMNLDTQENGVAVHALSADGPAVSWVSKPAI